VSKVFFLSDLHFFHKNICNMHQGHRVGTTSEEHDEWLIDVWNSKVKKRDLVKVLGDVCMGGITNSERLSIIGKLNGTKHLVLGNHDCFAINEYTKYFSAVTGLTKYKGYWLSHCPIHEAELRGKKNIHGHTHSAVMLDSSGIRDSRYVNVCVEASADGGPIPFEDIVSGGHTGMPIKKEAPI